MIQLFVNEDRKESHHFTVRNDSGQILYLIEGYWGKKKDTVNLFSLNGDLLLQAKQVNMSPFFKFDLIYEQEIVGSFRKHPGFFGLRDAFFTVQPKDWIIKGDFETLNFTTFQNGQEIIKTSKLLKQANYLYSLKVKREDDLVLASLLSILFDHYSRQKGKEKNYDKLSQNNYNLEFLNYKIQSKLYLDRKELIKKRK